MGHADEEGDADGLQAQPRRLPLLPGSAPRVDNVPGPGAAGRRGRGSPERFEVDATSPSVSGCCGDEVTYEILSRRTKFGDSHPHPEGGPCGGCCR